MVSRISYPSRSIRNLVVITISFHKSKSHRIIILAKRALCTLHFHLQVVCCVEKLQQEANVRGLIALSLQGDV